jgi:hypothetical protein
MAEKCRNRDPDVDQLAITTPREARGDLLELLEQLLHRRAAADDLGRPVLLAAGAALLLLALEEPVLFLETLLGGTQALRDARVRDGERRVLREDRRRIEVVAREDAGGFAVVDLDDAEDLVALRERDAERRADLRAMSDSL